MYQDTLKELAMLTKKIIVVFLLVFILAACISNPVPEESKVVVVTPAIKGNTARLKVGDLFEIQIPTIPLSDSKWIVDRIDKAILIQEGETAYVADDSPNSAGGTTTLKFKAVGTGSTELGLIYGNATEYSQSFSVAVTVE